MKLKLTFLTATFLFILASCDNKEDKKSDETVFVTESLTEPNSFSFEILQKSADDFLVFQLNKKTGDINVRNPNGSWYLAENNLSRTTYKYPAYDFKIIAGNTEDTFQIILLDNVSGEIYIRSYSNSWYLGTTPELTK
ncbi:conserved hypothetical protein [Flavobacterium sp. 9AF]|uniref:hypothetical protein n=1 Tax=Flavobacterium sp. 9AF TaxID=2653142 RepID=UPI0012EFE5C3|nr:hypothetical protein [Flavobacterium sp. 9AF]VXC32681.1 conserved hypothetical protein [Flavobacterium sp. 9AF]